MTDLYHYPLDVFSRIVRIFLKEKQIDFNLIEESPWQRKKTFRDVHMFVDIPTLELSNRTILEGTFSIINYFEKNSRASSLWGVSENEISEAHRISSLFNIYCFAEVTNNIVFEKLIRKYVDRSSPDSSSIRRGNSNIKKYFDYIDWLIDCRNWLAGETFTLADISAAAHISCIDYLGTIEWNNYPKTKNWYARIKSRPSFREILQDRIPNMPPVSHYSNLDF